MKYISKAPFRIGLAGGGTDVSPFSDLYGGFILNATIDLYATAIIVPRTDGQIVIHARNTGIQQVFESRDTLEIVPELALQIGVYNHIVKNFTHRPLSFELITTIDVPSGSGLGTSSTLVVAILGAFIEWLKLPLGEYDIAKAAIAIEREELAMAGGKQDQYAATFGGFNFMEFYGNDRVVVNPLRLKSGIRRELNHHLLLFYTQSSRNSSEIIEKQQANFSQAVDNVIHSSQQLKTQAQKMKEALLMGELATMGEILDLGWQHKKQLADGVSNTRIDDIYETARAAGAAGGKISGAGGGGFMIFYCPGNRTFELIDALAEKQVIHQRYSFQNNGLETWTSQT